MRLQKFIDSLSPSWEMLFWIIKIFTLMFIISTIIVVIVLVLLPSNYFNELDLANAPKQRRSVLYWMILLFKNLLGVVIVVAGVLMLFVPGQGLMTILIGIILLDFPKKRKLEKRIICKPKILSAVNLMRKRFGKPALIVDP